MITILITILILTIMLFEYGMALSCDCVLTVLILGVRGRHTRETESDGHRRTFELFLFLSSRDGVVVFCSEPSRHYFP